MYFSHCRNEFADPSAPLLTLFTVCDNAAHQTWLVVVGLVGSGLFASRWRFKSNGLRLASIRAEVGALRVPTIQGVSISESSNKTTVSTAMMTVRQVGERVNVRGGSPKRATSPRSKRPRCRTDDTVRV